MLVAIKLGATVRQSLVDSNGELQGPQAGVALVRRLLRVFPDACVIGDPAIQGNGFKVCSLEELDPDAVLINMDVIDSISVWRTLRHRTESPKVMNFLWWNATDFASDVERAELALSCAMMPTFCNSERTANQIHDAMDRWTARPVRQRAEISWVNIGIQTDKVRERAEPEVPVVLYPAIYVYDRKRPRDFLEVVEKVAKRTPIRVEARLSQAHLASDVAMRLSWHEWSWVGPLLPSRDEYWAALAQTTAFVATAVEESYGLEYLEALLAGVIGIFPDHAWVGPLVPKGYPFIYRDLAEAERMLTEAVTDPAKCRAQMDACAGGSIQEWVRNRHSDDNFEAHIFRQVREWFGADATLTR